MQHWLILCVVALWLLWGMTGWLGWQLLRQNGRMLLRLEKLESQLDDFELGEAMESLGPPQNGNHRPDAAKNDTTNRFASRSLARSRLNRDGLKAGTIAPGFRLPRLAGGELSLEELRGKRVLLVFSDPHCGPCQTLATHLEKFHGANTNMSVVMISRRERQENRAKMKEHGLTFPILLQQQWEISRLYAMFATPIAYLIDEQGVILNDVAVGVEAIVALIAEAKKHAWHDAPTLISTSMQRSVKLTSSPD
jgi:peroxiredoxin